MKNNNLNQTLEKYFKETNIVKAETLKNCKNDIIKAAKLIAKQLKQSKKILICGNGGSATDSMHLAAEFTNRFSKSINRPPLPAISLAADTAFITAHGNDFNFESIFSQQIEALGNDGDVLIAISTSGKSANIVKALKSANTKKMIKISLTGKNEELNNYSDITINIPSNNTQYIQESLLTIEHLLIYLVEIINYT